MQKKTMELVSGFPPLNKGRRTGGAKERAGNLIKADAASETSFEHVGENRANAAFKAKNNSIKDGGIKTRFALKYALKRMSRSGVGCLALLFVSAALALLLCELDFSLASKMDGLDGLYKNIEVKCVVSDLTGTKIDGLGLSDTYIDVCTSEYYTRWEHVKDIKLKRTLRYATEGEDEVERITIHHKNF